MKCRAKVVLPAPSGPLSAIVSPRPAHAASICARSARSVSDTTTEYPETAPPGPPPSGTGTQGSREESRSVLTKPTHTEAAVPCPPAPCSVIGICGPPPLAGGGQGEGYGAAGTLPGSDVGAAAGGPSPGPSRKGFLCERACRTGRTPENGRILNEWSILFVFFLHPAALTLWNRWKDTFRKCAKAIPIGNFPAFRPNGSAGRHLGRHRRAGSGGTMARRNRRVEPEGVRPSSPMAHGVAHRMADWRRRAGERAGERERRNGPARSPAWFFVCFFFREGVGRPRQAHFGR